MSAALELVTKEEKYTFSVVPPVRVPYEWPGVYNLLAPAVERSGGRWTMGDLLVSLCTSVYTLWIGYDSTGIVKAAAATQICSYPRCKMLSIQFLGGSGYDTWCDELLTLFEKYAKDAGCHGVEATARLGFWPLFKRRGYDRSYAVFETTFED